MTMPDLLATCSGGIIFTGESVRAIRDGRKTQTRRLLNPQPTNPSGDVKPDLYNHEPNCWAFWLPDNRMTEPRTWSPRYQPGKRYYVKETWCPAIDGGKFFYRVDAPDLRLIDGDEFGVFRKDGSEASPWRSPMHMPRLAARYVIEIDSANPQRLQDITEEDVRAEGVYTWAEGDHTCNVVETYFAPRWNEVNGKRAPWASNPWVWRYTFHLAQP